MAMTELAKGTRYDGWRSGQKRGENKRRPLSARQPRWPRQARRLTQEGI